MTPQTETITEERHVFEVGTLKFWALGDRVLIQEDEFKTGYECVACNGSGKTPCPDCDGTGHHGVKRCSHCDLGVIPCPECRGKGGLLVAPEISQRRPTTGRVVSTGPDCKHIHVDDSVMYSNFAGYVVDLVRAGRPVVIRILHETEILCGMEGQLDLRGFRGKSEIAEYAP